MKKRLYEKGTHIIQKKDINLFEEVDICLFLFKTLVILRD